jgi:hypothetical protein
MSGPLYIIGTTVKAKYALIQNVAKAASRVLLLLRTVMMQLLPYDRGIIDKIDLLTPTGGFFRFSQPYFGSRFQIGGVDL